MSVKRKVTVPEGRSRIPLNDGAGRAASLAHWRIRRREPGHQGVHFRLQMAFRRAFPKPGAQVAWLMGRRDTDEQPSPERNTVWAKTRSGPTQDRATCRFAHSTEGCQARALSG